MKTAEFKNHPIHQKILELKSRCNDQKTKDKIDADLLLFIKTHCQFLTDRLSIAILPLVNVDELNAIQDQLQSALIQLVEYLSDNNPGRLQTAQQNMNNSLPFVRNIPFLAIKGDFNFSEINANYSDYVDTKIAALNDSISKLNQGLADSETQFNSQNDFIESLKTQLADQQNQTNEMAEKFNLKLTEFANMHEQKIHEISQNHKLLFETMQDNLENQADSTLKEIRGLRDQAKDVLSALGIEATTSDFKKTAISHHLAANKLRRTSFILMYIICAIILYYIFCQKAAFDWRQYSLRLISIGIFIYPATYASKESTKHRSLAVENERAALELAAIEPFIVLLDEDKKQIIKEKLVDKYFGRDHRDMPKEPVDDNVKNVPIELIDRLIKLFKS
jgi:ElaB/YqjD/DUF883 family membrane-anchored ribosome-binding protein